MRNIKSVTSGAGTAYSSRAHDFSPSFWLGSCFSIFSFLCTTLWIIVYLCFLFLLVIVFSVLQLTSSDYHFVVFKFTSKFA